VARRAARDRLLRLEARGKAGYVLAGLVVVVTALVILGIVFDVPAGMAHHGGFVCLAAAFGAVVGASELVSRYRDEPTRALASASGGSYVFLMAVVSGLAYGLLTRYSSGLFPGLAGDPLMTSIVAGFGAMAVLRSKVFTLRTASGENIAVGPDAAISAFLDAADRGVDRARASKRLALVFEQAKAIKRPEQGPDFLEISIAALQNLSDEDKARFVQRIDQVQASGYPPQLKLQALCYELLTLIGERNFVDLMKNLNLYIAAGGSPSGGSQGDQGTPGAPQGGGVSSGAATQPGGAAETPPAQPGGGDSP
jgi:hypothetical protein